MEYKSRCIPECIANNSKNHICKFLQVGLNQARIEKDHLLL